VQLVADRERPWHFGIVRRQVDSGGHDRWFTR